MKPQSVVDVRHPWDGDVAIVADRLRRADVAECHAAGVTDIRGVIWDGVKHSELCWTACVNGRPEAIFGARSFGDWGVPWFLGTDAVLTHRRAFVRMAPRYIRMMLQRFPRLMNHVHVDNEQAVRWLRGAGFTLRDAHPHPNTGEAFILFTMEA